MTTYNTGNPIGSKDPRDLYDNAENLDAAVNDTSRDTWTDRLGRSRKTMSGMERQFDAAEGYREATFDLTQADRDARFNNFIASSGYQFLGDYAAGIEITEYNQIVRDSDGEFWRLSGQVELPYTTTGDWSTEGDLFVSVGDAALRQDLSTASGMSLISYQVNGAGAVVRNAVDRLSDVISVEDFGAKGDGVTDDTAAFLAAAEFARVNNVPLSSRGGVGYRVSETITFYTDTDIKAPIIMTANSVFRYIKVGSDKVHDVLDFSALGGLTEDSNQITGLPADAAGRFLHITSDEILTERNNPPSSTPYLKSTAVYITDSDGNCVPSLDMSFNSGYNTTVTLFKKEARITVRLHSVQLEGEGDVNFSIQLNRDSTDFYMGGFYAENSEARTIIGVNANDCNIYSTNLDDAAFTGLGYGITIGISCRTGIYGVKGASSRTELDGRHGSLVTVRDCIFKRAGSHWGNNYVFDNCHVGTYSWSGKNLTILGGSLHRSIFVRADVGLAIGSLVVDRLDWKGSTLVRWSSAVKDNYFTSPRRIFQNILVRNLINKGTSNIVVVGGEPTNNYPTNWAFPRSIVIDNVFAPNCPELTAARLPLDRARSFSHSSRFVVKDVDLHPNGKVTILQRGPGAGVNFDINFEISNCGEVDVRCDASAIKRMRINNCKVTGLRRINSSVANGVIELVGGSYNPSVVSYTEAPKGLINVELEGNVIMGYGSVDGPLLYQIGCRAKTGTTNYATPLDYYVNPSHYITE